MRIRLYLEVDLSVIRDVSPVRLVVLEAESGQAQSAACTEEERESPEDDGEADHVELERLYIDCTVSQFCCLLIFNELLMK